ncbi:uncharacterized protein BXZ73DRAFT_90907 [Epithele typhae]|uniref:uncharacterized protein n=1 Tax=Epithele typhae TaxID=378194 RepID=UPI002007D578|nr:uncharacterized protein BXZ73DRAFT_90907 [Epithele typhae]KAH9926623.1 hypothetical protein BXZ73DRAFT_90907 [Epithele typhae]
MADTQRFSQIPVMSSRPSLLSSPSLGLVPPSRYPSVSGSPSLANPAASPTSSSGSTSFRTFKSLLGIGGGNKQAATNTSPSAYPRRRASSPQLKSMRRSEDEYVLSIDLPRPGDVKFQPSMSTSSSPVGRTNTSSTNQSPAHSPSSEGLALNADVASPFATPALASTELSTISTLHPSPHDTRRGSTSPSNDTSALNISSSKIKDEPSWLGDSIVLDDVPSDSSISRGRTPESPDDSFNLHTLDPDLAALLSPNRVRGSSTDPAVTAYSVSRPPTPPPKTPSSTTTSPGPGSTHEPRASNSLRRNLPTSLSAAPRHPATTSLPRITRSVSDRPTFGTGVLSGPPSPVTSLPSSRAMSSSPDRVASGSSISSRMRITRAPSIDSTPNRRPGSTGNGSTTGERRSAASRLMTPARASISGISSRPPASRLTPSASPSSRAPSSVGTAPSRLQFERERPTEYKVIEKPVTMMSPPPLPSQHHLGPRSVTDWLGPRTARAFAAAGLLDQDGQETSPSAAGSSSSWAQRSISRAAGYPEGLSTGEAILSPRTVFSAASTAPTSVSASSLVSAELQLMQEKHAIETSALLNALADSQRTTKMLREENGSLRERIQALEDKLADTQERIQQVLFPQTSAISQINTGRSVYSSLYASPPQTATPDHGLRSASHSRNSSLRPRGDRAPFTDVRTSFDSVRAAQSRSRSPLDPRDALPPPSRRRASGSSSSQFASLPSNMSMLMRDEDPPDSFRDISPSGSPTMVYAHLGKGSSPGAHGKPQSRGGYSDVANRSMSSAGNVSPTTASFSITTGSPVSLNLRPEHEMHLGDMPPLDLDGEDFSFEHGVLR